jgi:hypothetical protein
MENMEILQEGLRELQANIASKIDLNTFLVLSSLDPKTQASEETNIAGDFVRWLIDKYNEKDSFILKALKDEEKKEIVKKTLQTLYDIKSKKIRKVIPAVFINFMNFSRETTDNKGQVVRVASGIQDRANGSHLGLEANGNKYFMWLSLTTDPVKPKEMEENEQLIKIDYELDNNGNQMAINIKKAFADNEDLFVDRNSSEIIVVNKKDEKQEVTLSDEDGINKFVEIKKVPAAQIPIDNISVEKKSFEQVYEQVKKYIPEEKFNIPFSLNPAYKDRVTAKDVKIVYDDETWCVAIPLTHVGAIAVTNNPRCTEHQERGWCTSYKSPTYYNRYSTESPLFVIVNKTKDEELSDDPETIQQRFQFHLGVGGSEGDVQFKGYKDDAPADVKGNSEFAKFFTWAEKNGLPLEVFTVIEQESGLLTSTLLAKIETLQKNSRNSTNPDLEIFKLAFATLSKQPIEKILSKNNAVYLFNIYSNESNMKKDRKKAESILNTILKKYKKELIDYAFKEEDPELIQKLLSYNINMFEHIVVTDPRQVAMIMKHIPKGSSEDIVNTQFKNLSPEVLTKTLNYLVPKEVSARGLKRFLDKGVKVEDIYIGKQKFEDYIEKSLETETDPAKKAKRKAVYDLIQQYKTSVTPEVKPRKPGTFK